MSFMPFSNYTATPATGNGFSVSCPSNVSIRSCFQTILANARAQGVTGIRIFVTFCTSDSKAFANCYSPYGQVAWNPNVDPGKTWIQNVGYFFQDVHNAGIQNVTILFGATGGFPKSEAISAASSPAGACSTPGNCCPDTPNTIYFNEFAPFGFDASNHYYPVGGYYSNPTCGNQGYNKAPINSQYFLGWTNIFNVINAVLAQAQGWVTVYEMGIQDEMNLEGWTVEDRFIYDNSMPQSAGLAAGQTVNVLSNLQSLMSAHGFDPGRVAYGFLYEDTDATAPTYNCANVYTDYARNAGMDEVTQAIIGGPIGISSSATAAHDLECNGSITGGNMFTSPMYSTLPDIVDTHVYPHVNGGTTTDALLQQVAAVDYGDIPHFLILAGQQSADIVIGETYSGQTSAGYVTGGGGLCWPGLTITNATDAANNNVAGFNQSALASYTVTFRPFMELEDASGGCFAYGGGTSSQTTYQNVNYNGQGPYTPTHH